MSNCVKCGASVIEFGSNAGCCSYCGLRQSHVLDNEKLTRRIVELEDRVARACARLDATEQSHAESEGKD